MLSPAVTANRSQLVPFHSIDSTDGSRTLLDRKRTPQFGRVLFGLDAEALAARMVEAGEPAWRGRQLAEALYRQRIADLDAITTLPKPLRRRLTCEGWQVGRPRIIQVFQSVDGTERYLVHSPGQGLETAVPGESLIVAGAETVETVWMPEGDDGESGDESAPDMRAILGAPGLSSEAWESDEPHSSRRSIPPRVGTCNPRRESLDKRTLPDGRATKRWDRATICVSSQVGCAVNCRFCLTAKLGLQRNLSAGEIAGQVLAVFERHAVAVGRDRVSLVFMGMGEPFLNYENFMAAVRLLVREAGLSPRRMTVSTSGIVPGIERFAQEPAEVRPKLAISLNAPNDRIRGEIMPINRKWPIAEVMNAVHKVQLRPRERITFEYVLLAGVTDRPEHAAEVAKLVRRAGLPVKVNLIAWNPGPGIDYSTPRPEAVETFRQTLAGEGIPTYLRKPRGRDIYAACGQLKRTVEG